MLKGGRQVLIKDRPVIVLEVEELNMRALGIAPKMVHKLTLTLTLTLTG